MAPTSRKASKQDIAIKKEPKFSPGYKFYVPSIYFGKRWVQKTFRKNFERHFLLGCVKKVQTTKKNIYEYLILFTYDGQRLIFDEDLVLKQIPSTISVELDKCSDGYVVIKADDFDKLGHGDLG